MSKGVDIVKLNCFFFQAPSDEDFHGPLEHRECRDIIFLIIFLAFIVGMV